jgi:serine/threonine-protein kinase
MIGRILRQRYKIINELGAGGFGETYLAEDLDIPVKPKCVVKRLQPQIQNPDTVSRFRKEAEILYKLGNSHDRIPTLYGYFEDKGEFYLVQEFIDGHDLQQEIYSWNEDDVIKFLREILEVLEFVHQEKVIHRDIKPSNIMRRKCDDKLILIDFGTIKESISTGQTSITLPVGTPGYRPIEQERGQPKFCSDIYAVGMAAIQALVKAHPFMLIDSNTLEVTWQNRVQVSSWLEDFLTKMVQNDFRQRYIDAGEALQALYPTLVSPSPLINPSTPVLIDSKFGYIDQTGPVFIQPTFDTHEAIINSFFEWLTPVKIGKKWGYANQAKQIVIPPQFDYAWGFSEGLAVVKIDNKLGYINQTGEIVIPPQFDKAQPFAKGRAQIKIDKHQRYIDKAGKFIEPE